MIMKKKTGSLGTRLSQSQVMVPRVQHFSAFHFSCNKSLSSVLVWSAEVQYSRTIQVSSLENS